MDDSDDEADLCRVCRCKGTPSRPLFYPCVCSGSIKYTHNDCLIRWLSHSKREMCELCNHHIAFSTIYAHGMPNQLPIKDVLTFIFMVVMKQIVCDVRQCLVIAVWLCVVPSIEWRLHQCMFNGTVEPLTSLLRFDLRLFHYIFNDLVNGLPILALKIFLFGSMVMVNRQVMSTYGLDRERLNYERIVMNTLFLGDHEEEDEEDERYRIEFKLFVSSLVGSNGPLMFLKYVIFITLLNAFSVFALLFCPYFIGKLVIIAMALQDKILALHFEGLLTMLFGYCLITMLLFVVHNVATFIRLGSYKQSIWCYYVGLKVTILTIVMLGVIPFVTALWMDVCSLSMFNISVNDRIQSFYDFPENFVFLHWLTGFTSLMFFIPIFDVFHKVARPGLLRFLENLIDYTNWFNWTQELIKENMCYHGRKMIVSMTLYGTVIVVFVWIPARIVGCAWPSFLPYTAPTKGYYLDEWSSLIRLLLAAMLRYDVAQRWAESAVRFWCVHACRALGMESYLLLGDDAAPHEAVHDPPPPPYARPANLKPRLYAASAVAFLTAVAVGLVVITVPVCAIRLVMSLSAPWLPAAPSARPYRQMHVAEIFTTLLNVFLGCVYADSVYPRLRTAWSGARAAAAACAALFAEHPARASVACAGLLFVAPRLCAVLLHLFVLVPAAVPAHQSPVIRDMQHAAFCLCCAGLSVLLFVFAPARPPARSRADRLAGYRLAVCAASLLFAVPYAIAYSAVPFAIGCRRAMTLLPPVTFPLLVAAAIAVKLLTIVSDVYAAIHRRILHDKYAVGKQLVNYEPRMAVAQH